MKTTAIILSAGSGKRMGSSVKKQYIEMAGKPVIYYSIKAFEDSGVDEIVLVASAGDEQYCKDEIVDRYGFKKVKSIVAGGAERYNSVFNGLMASKGCDYVFIHDGARPFVDNEIIERCLEAVMQKKACVTAVKVKDTIKLEDGDGNIEQNLNRDLLWAMQTPQVFDFELIRDCYDKMIRDEKSLLEKGIKITDDTMAVELYSDVKVALVEGSYNNIKITTPEDLIVGERILG